MGAIMDEIMGAPAGIGVMPVHRFSGLIGCVCDCARFS